MSVNQNVLCVGLCCLDIISEVAKFPLEDTDQRCIDQRWQRGGNAANNCTVLGLLGANPSFCGTVAASHEKSFIMEDFEKYGVNTDNSVICEGCDCPVSCVILSAATGSRTIIHSNKNLPELSMEDFAKINLNSFKWVHFEGRNVSNVCNMISHVKQYNKNHKGCTPITVSVEIEKAKPELEALIPLANVIFVAKDYAKFKGYADMDETIKKIQSVAMPGAVVICPWGEAGASASDAEGRIVRSSAFPPSEVIDTLGAGDTFNAATIFALFNGRPLQESISFGCKIAGAKVGVRGWEPLREIVKNSVLDIESANETRGIIST